MACLNRFRYCILLLGFFCLLSICANYMVINFAFICMTEDKADLIEITNGTRRQSYDYTPAEKSWLMWAVAAGTIIATFPINYAYVRFGAKYPFAVAGLLSALSTAAIPAAAHLGLFFFILIRILQGLAFAADFAAVGVLTVRWAPLAETGIFLGFFTSFTPLANTAANAITGSFCTSSLGWRWAFYSHSIFCVLVFVLWLIFYSDDPQTHPSVSSAELETIQKDKTKEHIERDSFVPYWDIITNKTVLVVWFNALTELVSVVSLLTYAPIYIHKVLHFDLSTTAVVAALASFLHFPIKLVFSFFSDYITRFSEVVKMNFFNTIALGLCGLAAAMIPFSPSRWFAVAGFIAVNMLAGANSSGFYKCGTLHSRQYAHFVLATIQFMKCAALFIGPGLTALFLMKDEDAGGWTIVFLINAIAMITANCLFYFVCTDQPAAFTRISRSSSKGTSSEMASGD